MPDTHGVYTTRAAGGRLRALRGTSARLPHCSLSCVHRHGSALLPGCLPLPLLRPRGSAPPRRRLRRRPRTWTLVSAVSPSKGRNSGRRVDWPAQPLARGWDAESADAPVRRAGPTRVRVCAWHRRVLLATPAGVTASPPPRSCLCSHAGEVGALAVGWRLHPRAVVATCRPVDTSGRGRDRHAPRRPCFLCSTRHVHGCIGVSRAAMTQRCVRT